MTTTSTTSSTHPVSEPDPDLVAGQQVGEYEVESKLGHGGFGAVFKASHPLIGKVVAIKVLARRFSVDPEMVDRFQAEARAVNQIRHRNIIDIFSFGRLPDGRAYYVMEYLDGETLDARLARDGRMPLAVAVPILRAIGKALDAAHAQGIAHRDLKPENVFLAVDPDGEAYPKLLDFGIAKLMRREDALKSKTRTGVPMGTPYYMSPEQCRGRDVDHRTDYYAFGVVAYQLVTGAVPIDGDDYMSILMKQIGEEPVPASSLCQELPSAVDDVLAWLMRKDPAERPANLAAAVKALEAAAGMTPKRTTPTGIAVPAVPSRSPSELIDALATTGVAADVASSTVGANRRVTTGAGTGATTNTTTATPRSRWMLALAPAVALAGAIGWYVVSASTPGEPLAPDHQVTEAGSAVVAGAAAPPPPQGSASVAAPGGSVASGSAVEPASSDVTIEVVGVPPATRIHDSNGVTFEPPKIRLPRGVPVTLTFEAAGYQTVTRAMTPTDDAALDVELRPLPHPHTITTPRPPRAHDSNSIEHPREFGNP